MFVLKRPPYDIPITLIATIGIVFNVTMISAMIGSYACFAPLIASIAIALFIWKKARSEYHKLVNFLNNNPSYKKFQDKLAEFLDSKEIPNEHWLNYFGGVHPNGSCIVFNPGKSLAGLNIYFFEHFSEVFTIYYGSTILSHHAPSVWCQEIIEMIRQKYKQVVKNTKSPDISHLINQPFTQDVFKPIPAKPAEKNQPQKDIPPKSHYSNLEI